MVNDLDAESTRLNFLTEMVEHCFGHKLPDGTFKKFAAVQGEMHRRHMELLDDLQAGRITEEIFHEKFSPVLKRGLLDCEAVLGERRFRQMFGQSAIETAGMIDLLRAAEPEK